VPQLTYVESNTKFYGHGNIKYHKKFWIWGSLSGDMKSKIEIWGLTPCCSEKPLHFGGTYRFHHKGGRVSQARIKQKEATSSSGLSGLLRTISHSSSGKKFISQYIQNVPWGKVNILEGHTIGHSKQKVYTYMCPTPNGFPDRAISLYRRATRHVLTELQSALMLTVEFSKMYYPR
jgi:hypothetical protein